jgi:hypothetical protein
MKSLKYITLIGALCVGLTTLSRATVTQIGNDVDLPNSGEGAELQGFIDAGGDADATLCFKSDREENPDFLGSITFSVNDDNTLHVEFDMTGTGQEICGFLTKDGGGNLVHYYAVIDGQGAAAGEFDLEVPANGASALSHLTVFCCEGVGVPDGGATVMLLGAALGALGMVRRYLKS